MRTYASVFEIYIRNFTITVLEAFLRIIVSSANSNSALLLTKCRHMNIQLLGFERTYNGILQGAATLLNWFNQ